MKDKRRHCSLHLRVVLQARACRTTSSLWMPGHQQGAETRACRARPRHVRLRPGDATSPRPRSWVIRPAPGIAAKYVTLIKH